MTDRHLTEEQLAILAEGGDDPSIRLLREHVRGCDECAGALDDVVRYRALWLADPSVFRATDTLVARASAVVDGEVERRPRDRAAIPTFWRSWAPVLGSVAVVVVLVAALTIWHPLGNGPDYASLFQPVQNAVAVASMEGAIVIPGGESAASTTIPEYRSGIATEDAIIASSLQRLAALYHRNPSNADVAHWLISGYLAVGDLDNAAVFVDDARRRFPGDIRFTVLEALVAYRLNDFDRAERLLHTAVRTDPDYGPALLNLGLVQYERGQLDSARQVFETVRTQFAGTPLQARADALIQGLLNG